MDTLHASMWVIRFSSRRLSAAAAATADLDFVQASLRAESRGEEGNVSFTMISSPVLGESDLFNAVEITERGDLFFNGSPRCQALFKHNAEFSGRSK